MATSMNIPVQTLRSLRGVFSLMNKDGNIVVEVYINDNKELVDSLYSNKDEREDKFDEFFSFRTKFSSSCHKNILLDLK